MWAEKKFFAGIDERYVDNIKPANGKHNRKVSDISVLQGNIKKVCLRFTDKIKKFLAVVENL